ncbi:hypothetical protein [Sphingomonas sp. BK345]|uniref:hypothetical protein n=1 Tax=Sphingomonas sp. BK345 TaxID=2586980 RepID=UPI001612B141|nr:hypothetical protein [Sphingomonas sp. BK345]MBB3473786.1 hypothetical protein [Sphingomonas sp. BK345]
MSKGRALRCWGLLLALWVSARAAWLWRDGVVPRRSAAMVASTGNRPPGALSLAYRRAAATARVATHPPIPASDVRPGHASAARPLTSPRPPRPSRLIAAAERATPEGPMPLTGSTMAIGPSSERRRAPITVGSAVPEDAALTPRWSQTGWLLLRGGATTSTAAPQLGGAQLGVRLARGIDDEGRLAASLRLVSALQAHEREAIAAIEWHPRALPLRVLAERRVGVAGLRGGWGLGVAGGVSDRTLSHGALLDGYVQAGVIERRGGYADGAVSLEQPVTRRGEATLRLGLGAWGAAQRAAERLDVGPTATLRLGRARATLAWRARVAGDARPGSGAALTIGIDH